MLQAEGSKTEEFKVQINELKESIEALKSFIESHSEGIEKEIVEEIPKVVQALDSLDDKFLSRTKFSKHFLKNWLEEKGIWYSGGIASLKSDQKIVQAANFLSKNYNHLKDFYETLKRFHNIRKDFYFVSEKSTLNYILEWSQVLDEIKVIDEVKISGGRLDIAIAEIKEATFFINGYWLEVLLKSVVAEFLKNNLDKISTFDVLSQLKVTKPDGNTAEFDLLVMLNNHVFWFECKSGDIGKYYERFKEHQQILQLDYEHSIALIPEGNPQIVSNFQNRSNMMCFFATDVERQLSNLLNQLL